MAIKIINIIFLNLKAYLLKLTNSSFAKNIKKNKIKNKLLKLFRGRIVWKGNKRKRFSKYIRRRWRWFYFRARRFKLYFRYRIRRRLKKFRRRYIRKTRKIRKLLRFLLYFFILCARVQIIFFADLLRRFNVFSISFKLRRRRRRYLGNGRYDFDKLILDTFLVKRKNLLILIVGHRKFLPEGYSYLPWRVWIFNSINKLSFYIKRSIKIDNFAVNQIILIRKFKLSNLFLKPYLINTDLFLKLNIKSSAYNIFLTGGAFSKIIPKRINITMRQISLLKVARNRTYSLYYKKSRSYRVTKFFLKLSTVISMMSWLLNWEFRLVNILLRSKFARSFKVAVFLITNGYIFLNGVAQLSPNYVLSMGDRVQIPVNSQWFLEDRLQTSSFNKILGDINLYVFKNRIHKKRTFQRRGKDEKTWLLDNLRNFNKTPDYMEVDYTTLSIILIKKNVKINDVLPIYSNTFKPMSIRLYNWRYFY